MLSDMRIAARIAVLISLPVLSGCALPGYYSQAVNGELNLLAARRPIKRIIADPATPAALRQKLILVQHLRQFASARLGLPNNGSYTSYVQLHRPYVSWNVFATKAFSLQPIRWCFAFAGCVPYRGYFHRQAAEAFAARLRRQGDDVYVGGVSAFSTLGWFDDPLLSSMLDWDDLTLANFIFHELAHQELYVEGDADFNESYAVTVADVGVRRWLAADGRAGELPAYQARQRHWHMIVLLVDSARSQLAQLYASGEPRTQMALRKQRIFAQLRHSYAVLRPQLGSDAGYDGFFGGALNNAALLTVVTYTRWLPAFRALLQQHGNLPEFYQAVKRLARLPRAARDAALEKLMVKSAAAKIAGGSGK
jgi:predicted aminopeptidase